MLETAQPQSATRYESARSAKDKALIVICHEGRFYDLPDQILHLGPWQGSHRGDVERLRRAYRAMLTLQGFAVVYAWPFEPEAN
ncbi:MAG TPA: hypothetical protein VG758_22850 [Hyphomicrobiaceae bacterium]|jgi:hypothetical protein|nr:hypothetical protein [Hyphomicrobiaceae bacterium]